MAGRWTQLDGYSIICAFLFIIPLSPVSMPLLVGPTTTLDVVKASSTLPQDYFT